MMYALDTNILVYAHNISSPFHPKAKIFIENVVNDCDEQGQPTVCVPAQVLMEFLNVITWSRLDTPLPLNDATEIVQDYIDTGVAVLYPKSTQLETVLDLLKSVTSRKKIFDVALAATLKDHEVGGLYTVNTKDFREFKFLDVKNPFN